MNKWKAYGAVFGTLLLIWSCGDSGTTSDENTSNDTFHEDISEIWELEKASGEEQPAGASTIEFTTAGEVTWEIMDCTLKGVGYSNSSELFLAIEEETSTCAELELGFSEGDELQMDWKIEDDKLFIRDPGTSWEEDGMVYHLEGTASTNSTGGSSETSSDVSSSSSSGDASSATDPSSVSSSMESSSSENTADGTQSDPYSLTVDGVSINHAFSYNTPANILLDIPSAGTYYLEISTTLGLAGVVCNSDWSAVSHLDTPSDHVIEIDAASAGVQRIRLYHATTGISYDAEVSLLSIDPRGTSSSSSATGPSVPNWLLGYWDPAGYNDPMTVTDSMILDDVTAIMDGNMFIKDSIATVNGNQVYFLWVNDSTTTSDHYEFVNYASQPDSMTWHTKFADGTGFYSKYTRASAPASSSSDASSSSAMGTSSSENSSSAGVGTGSGTDSDPYVVSGAALVADAVELSEDTYYTVLTDDDQFFKVQVTAGTTYYIYVHDYWTSSSSPLTDHNYKGDIYLTAIEPVSDNYLLTSEDFFSTAVMEEVTPSESGFMKLNVSQGSGASSGDLTWGVLISTTQL